MTAAVAAYKRRCDAATRAARRTDPALLYVLVPCENDDEKAARDQLIYMRDNPWEYGWRGVVAKSVLTVAILGMLLWLQFSDWLGEIDERGC